MINRPASTPYFMIYKIKFCNKCTGEQGLLETHSCSVPKDSESNRDSG